MANMSSGNLFDLLNINSKKEDEKRFAVLEALCFSALKYLDNNVWVFLKKGVPLRGQEHEVFDYKIGDQFVNGNNAVEENLRNGFYGNGAIFMSIRRELARESEEDDEMTEGLSKDIAHKIEFIRNDNAIIKRIKPAVLISEIPDSELQRITKIIIKRGEYDLRCSPYKRMKEEFDF